MQAHLPVVVAPTLLGTVVHSCPLALLRAFTSALNSHLSRNTNNYLLKDDLLCCMCLWPARSQLCCAAWLCDQECLNAQQARPVLDDLQECLSSRQQLVTSCTAVHQFQKLVDAFAGQREHRRWQELQQRLQVYHLVSSEGPGQQCNCDFLGHPAAADCSDDRCSCNSMVQQYKQPERIVGIKKMTEQQKAVFGLGEVLKAITLTANGNAIRSALSAGVHLECVLHRPIWLTGL